MIIIFDIFNKNCYAIVLSFHDSVSFIDIDFENVFRAQKLDSKANEDSPMELSLADDKDVFSEFTGVSPLGKADDAKVSAADQGVGPLSGNDLKDDDDTVSPKLYSLTRPSLLTGKDRRVSESAISDAGYRAVSSASEENLLGAKYKCVDVADIKMLAKMQEESEYFLRFEGGCTMAVNFA